MIDLRLGDCVDVMRSMPDGCVDAVVTDPPYNVGLTYKGADDDRVDYGEWCSDWFGQLKRVCIGPILISCGVANLDTWHHIEKPKWVLCWWKPASSGRCTVGFNNWEPVLLYGSNYRRGSCDVIRTTEQASLPARHAKEAIDHPCPKPVEWAVKQIASLTQDDASILDPFLGSGTTGIACVRLGRDFIGIEQDAEYLATARRRIAAEQAKTPLFATG